MTPNLTPLDWGLRRGVRRKRSNPLEDMSTQTPIVRVGVAAVVRDAHGKMVMGIRKGSHGVGESSTRSLHFSQQLI